MRPNETLGPPVLDASAILAFLQSEPGADQVTEVLQDSVISAVNLAEVLQKSIAHDIDITGLAADLEALGLRTLPFDQALAELSASIWPLTRSYGLSFADRACFALGLQLNSTVYTGDQEWAKVGPRLRVPVKLIRRVGGA